MTELVTEWGLNLGSVTPKTLHHCLPTTQEAGTLSVFYPISIPQSASSYVYDRHLFKLWGQGVCVCERGRENILIRIAILHWKWTKNKTKQQHPTFLGILTGQTPARSFVSTFLLSFSKCSVSFQDTPICYFYYIAEIVLISPLSELCPEVHFFLPKWLIHVFSKPKAIYFKG